MWWVSVGNKYGMYLKKLLLTFNLKTIKAPVSFEYYSLFKA
jgi:hypothetical protein